ncbi:unnamed protein product [Malus baccata var. baccata]
MEKLILALETEYPLRSIIHSPDALSKVTKWAIELGQYEIVYCPRTSIKTQALVDFVAKFTLITQSTREIYMDESSSIHEANTGMVLQTSDNFIHA